MSDFTVGFLPWWPQNPYQILLKRELNERNVRVIGNPPLRPLHILLGRDGLNVVHVHWPHGLYARKPWRFPFVMLIFILYRLMKNNIVWTVHELEFHEPNRPALDRFTRFLLMKISRCLIVHGEDTSRKIRERFDFKRAIHVVKHPSYRGWYPDSATRAEARGRLGIPDQKRVFLFFGYVKPYKGVEELISCFKRLPGKDYVLVVAGKPVDDATANRINSLAAEDDRILTRLGYIEDAEVQYYFRAADVAVFPFRDTQTSGSIMLALTFGLPIVAPATGTIPEHVSSQTAELFDPKTSDGLLDALTRCKSRDLSEMRTMATAVLNEDDWREMARVHLEAYKQALS